MRWDKLEQSRPTAPSSWALMVNEIQAVLGNKQWNLNGKPRLLCAENERLRYWVTFFIYSFISPVASSVCYWCRGERHLVLFSLLESMSCILLSGERHEYDYGLSVPKVSACGDMYASSGASHEEEYFFRCAPRNWRNKFKQRNVYGTFRVNTASCLLKQLSQLQQFSPHDNLRLMKPSYPSTI